MLKLLVNVYLYHRYISYGYITGYYSRARIIRLTKRENFMRIKYNV